MGRKNKSKTEVPKFKQLQTTNGSGNLSGRQEFRTDTIFPFVRHTAGSNIKFATAGKLKFLVNTTCIGKFKHLWWLETILKCFSWAIYNLIWCKHYSLASHFSVEFISYMDLQGIVTTLPSLCFGKLKKLNCFGFP